MMVKTPWPWHRAVSPFVVLPLLVLALFLVGCPKRPATTSAAAPAPGAPAAATPGTGPGGVMAGTGVPGAPGMGPGGRTPGMPPSPREFSAAVVLNDIHFDFDKYDIRPEDAKILDENAKWMKANQTTLVLIEGHCDERGTNEYNLALGERRAKATMNYLVSQGVQAGRITLISYGEERPVCAEKNEACWSENRRSHFMVRAR